MNLEKKSTFYHNLRKDRGVAGLSILMAVTAMIFIIGFLVMVFALIGGELEDTTETVVQNTVGAEAGWINQTTYTVDGATDEGFRNFVLTSAVNTTSGALIQPANYTYDQLGVVTNATVQVWSAVQFNYTYTSDANNTATEAIGNTVSALAGVSSWFPIIITISVMVALILLTVIIIVAIRQSGILAGGQ